MYKRQLTEDEYKLVEEAAELEAAEHAQLLLQEETAAAKKNKKKWGKRNKNECKNAMGKVRGPYGPEQQPHDYGSL